RVRFASAAPSATAGGPLPPTAASLSRPDASEIRPASASSGHLWRVEATGGGRLTGSVHDERPPDHSRGLSFGSGAYGMVSTWPGLMRFGFDPMTPLFAL